MSSKKSIKKDVPEADTPKADTQKADTPKADTLKADTLKKDTPKRKNISPLRYPGGKTRACKKIDEILSEYFDINIFSTYHQRWIISIPNKYDLPILMINLHPFIIFEQCKIPYSELNHSWYR